MFYFHFMISGMLFYIFYDNFSFKCMLCRISKLLNYCSTCTYNTLQQRAGQNTQENFDKSSIRKNINSFLICRKINETKLFYFITFLNIARCSHFNFFYINNSKVRCTDCFFNSIDKFRFEFPYCQVHHTV